MRILKYLLIITLMSCQEPANNSFRDRNIIAGSITKTDLFLIYATWDSLIVVEDIGTGEILHNIKIQNNCYARPLLHNNKLYFPWSDSDFSCYDLALRQIIWNRKIGGACRSFELCKQILVINEKDYGISGIDMSSGDKKYELKYTYDVTCSIPDLSPYYIVCNQNYFYVCNWICKTITAFDGVTGKEIWNKTFGSAVSNAISVNNYIFLGIDNSYQEGKIYLLDSKTGKILFEQNNKFQVRFNPILSHNKIYFYSYDNKLNRFNVTDKTNEVVFNFNDGNNPGGGQMYLLDNYLYYSAGDPMFIYRFDINNNKLEKVKKAEKSLYEVYTGNKKKIEFIY